MHSLNPKLTFAPKYLTAESTRKVAEFAPQPGKPAIELESTSSRALIGHLGEQKYKPRWVAPDSRKLDNLSTSSIERIDKERSEGSKRPVREGEVAQECQRRGIGHPCSTQGFRNSRMASRSSKTSLSCLAAPDPHVRGWYKKGGAKVITSNSEVYCRYS